jgi:hypothetical protein
VLLCTGLRPNAPPFPLAAGRSHASPLAPSLQSRIPRRPPTDHASMDVASRETRN